MSWPKFSWANTSHWQSQHDWGWRLTHPTNMKTNNFMRRGKGIRILEKVPSTWLSSFVANPIVLQWINKLYEVYFGNHRQTIHILQDCQVGFTTLEDLANTSYNWPWEKSSSNKPARVYEVDEVRALQFQLPSLC